MPQQPPLIWVLQGPRAGDNAQARALAALLGGDIELRSLAYNWTAKIPNLFRGASLSTLQNHAAAKLKPPWPDFVIGVGRRMAPVLLAVKKRSQGHSKIICIGRPRMPLAKFDLVLTTPQYALPAAANIVELPLPLHEAVPAKARDRELLNSQWSRFPKPWIVVVVGGQKFPFRLGRDELTALGRKLAILANEAHGSVMLFSSPRTPPGGLATVAQWGNVASWRSDQVKDGNQLYRAALELGDVLVVTSDSVSMISDMVATPHRVYVARLPISRLRISWDTSTALARWLSARGLVQPPRNVPAFVDRLLSKKTVLDLDELNTVQQRNFLRLDEQAIRARVLALNDQ